LNCVAKSQATYWLLDRRGTGEIQVRQVGDQLYLWTQFVSKRAKANGYRSNRRAHGAETFDHHKLGWARNEFILNGKSPGGPMVSIEPTDFRGTLVIGAIPGGHDPWKGIVRVWLSTMGRFVRRRRKTTANLAVGCRQILQGRIFPAALYMFQEGTVR